MRNVRCGVVGPRADFFERRRRLTGQGIYDDADFEKIRVLKEVLARDQQRSVVRENEFCVNVGCLSAVDVDEATFGGLRGKARKIVEQCKNPAVEALSVALDS